MTMKKTALITGAAGGIGQALATSLAYRGYQLLLVDRDSAQLAFMVQLYPGSKSYVLDQTDRAQVAEFCDTILANTDFDVAIINAGMLVIGELTQISRAALGSQLEVNLNSAAVMIQSLAQRMSLVNQGHILATVSMGGIVSLKGSAAYSASKFGLRGLLWALRDELRSKGVHVTGIYPAGVDTPMLRHEALHGGSALNFVGEPVSTTDVVQAFLAAIEKPQLEVYVPWSEGVTGRVAGAWPGMLATLYPLLERLGEAGRKKFIKRINN
jgi:short-subunit dehydrogenase